MSFDALHVAATDRASGSSQIAARAANAFAEMASTLSADAIRSAGRTLVRGQPIMAACLRLVDDVLHGLDEDGPPGAQRAARAFASRVSDEHQALVAELDRTFPSGGTVLTVSASSVVTAALCRRSDLRAICAVSEPGGEGRTLAGKLSDAGINAVVIPDGAVAQQSTRADLIVFGADALGTDSLLNKTGTLGAALGARSNTRPSVCVAGTTKLVDAAAWPVLQTAAEGLRLEGVPVFEEVPSSLVTSFVTESGSQSVRAMRKLARSARLDQRVIAWLSE